MIGGTGNDTLFGHLVGSQKTADLSFAAIGDTGADAINLLAEGVVHGRLTFDIQGGNGAAQIGLSFNLADPSTPGRHLKEGGSVINIGSGVSRVTPPNTAVYTATKGAVDAITGVLSKELGPKKVRVNSINPGLVDTEGARTLGVIGSEMEAGFVAQTPLGRAGQPADIAAIAVFLASDDAGWLTGETLIAAGGMR
jgi:NAD(P)-dependent dehydrogenase (short-subunit alcohol dehydrogenase family)